MCHLYLVCFCNIILNLWFTYTTILLSILRQHHFAIHLVHLFFLFILLSFVCLLIKNVAIDSLTVSYRVVLEVAGNSDAVILSGLEADTQYQVTVAALWGGHKYRSRPIVFRTLGELKLIIAAYIVRAATEIVYFPSIIIIIKSILSLFFYNKQNVWKNTTVPSKCALFKSYASLR